MTGFAYPSVSPIMMQIGVLEIRWYSMAYLLGIIIAWFLILRNIKRNKLTITRSQVDDMVFNITLGIILGGRIFYVLFYNFGMFLEHPFEIFALWHGGMSFHGGLVGATIGLYVSAKKMHYPFFGLSDLVALYAPIGLFLGRLANFVNDELWGRVTDVPWAVRFPSGGFLPRHPSQIYEAISEGIILFIVLNFLWRFDWTKKHPGFISGMFLSGYGLCRIVVEKFRQPDAQLGFITADMTMGQVLSMPVFIVGIYLIIRSIKRKAS